MLLVGGPAHHLPSIKFSNTSRCRGRLENLVKGNVSVKLDEIALSFLACTGRTHHLGLVMTECIVTRKTQFSPVATHGHFC
jgi:hypothetical protein